VLRLDGSWLGVNIGEEEAKTMKKIVSLSDRINQLRDILHKADKIGFKDFIKSAKNRSEVVVSFLALLELAKQRHLVAEQNDGDDIVIYKFLNTKHQTPNKHQ